MKKIAQIMLISVLVSCSNNYENELIKELTDRSVNLSIGEARSAHFQMESSYLDNPEKAKHFYLLSKARLKSTLQFVERIDNLRNPNNQDSINTLIIDYEILKDSLINTIELASCHTDSLMLNDSLKSFKHNKFLMKLNIAILNLVAQNCLVYAVDGCNMKFIPSDISTLKKVEGDTVQIHLVSHGIQIREKRYTSIDSVKLNGVIIESPFIIEPNYTFNNLVGTNLTQGKYEVFGKVDFFPLVDLKVTREFSHTFEQK